LCLLGGAFALGRMTHAINWPAAVSPRPAAAASEMMPPARTVMSGSGRAPQSFAPLAAEASPAVVHIKVVSVVKAAEGGVPFGLPPGMFGDEDGAPRGFR